MEDRLLIKLEDVLDAIVGMHYPQADSALDDISLGNMDKIALIANWLARELTLEGGLEQYLKSPYASAKQVAIQHETLIMDMLEWFEPQVKTYYETYLLEDEQND